MTNDRSAWDVLYRTLATMNRWQVWVPLFVYLILKLGLGFAYHASSSGAASSFWGIFLSADARVQLAHYPFNYYFMPIVMDRIGVGLDILVSALFQGATIVLFWRLFTNEPTTVREALRLTGRRYVPLVIVTVVAAGALYLWFYLQTVLEAGPLRSLPPLVGNGLFIGGGLCLQALFVYAVPFVVIDECAPIAALKQCVAEALRMPLRAFWIVSVPFALTLPALYVAGKSPYLVQVLSPEVVVPIHIFQEVVHWPYLVLLSGAVAGLFVRRK